MHLFSFISHLNLIEYFITWKPKGHTLLVVLVIEIRFMLQLAHEINCNTRVSQKFCYILLHASS